ncbi:hypothetical protein VTI28DRAFT_7389 [Corynascus sepedonium]
MSRRRGAIVLNKPAAGLRDLSERQRKADEDNELFLDSNIEDELEKRDFNQLWLDLCRDDQEAKAVIRSYFRDYVETSQTVRPALGPQEYEVVQTITTTKTVIEHWKHLVGEADNTILRPMRRKQPHNHALWKLRWDRGEPKDRLVADITNWIRKDLAQTFGLRRESDLTFVKVETMAEDILLLLDVLWTRPEDRPILEYTDYLELHWKTDMLDREIFPIDYHTFWKVWHRLWLVAGNREPIRPYSIRVGAGAKLDGALGPLTPALRSYFMANDEKVFQRNYLPQHIRKEIMPIIFGPEVVGTNEQLHKMLRQATVNRDQNAPLYPTIEDVESFEKRCDMQELKQKYIASRDDKGSDHLETKRALSEYLKRRKLLIDLKVQEIREEYFTEADRRRALGQSTSDMLTPTAKLYKPQTQTAAVDRLATNIGRFLREKDLGGQRRPQVFSQLLLAYLAKRGTEIETIMDSLEGKKPQDTT